MNAQILNQLVEGLDDDFWSAVPTPDPSPVKKPSHPSSSATPITPTKFRASSALKAVSSSTLFSATNHNLDDFLQGSEDWNLDDDPLTPSKPGPSKPQATTPKYIPDPCTRCVVSIVTEEYVNNRWRKSISGKTQPGEEQVEVHLCDDWYQADIRPDDIVNVIGVFTPASPSQPRTINITAAANLLILHPDLLTTATALSTAPQCRRKPLLSGLIRSTSDITPALVYGSVLHEVMQRCLREDSWEDAYLEKCIEDAVQDALGELAKLGVSEEIARTEVREKARGLKPFREKYMGEEPKPNGALTNTRSGHDDVPALLAITKLLDIEEDIWSPTYGLKGKIDATVQGIILDPLPPALSTSGYPKKPFNTSPMSCIPTRTSTPLPLELKTGRAIAGMEHRAQTLLYTLLLSERYGVDVQDGLLFYSQNEEGSIVRVPRGRNEIRALIGVRNELASWGWRRVRKNKTKVIAMDGDVTMEVAEKVEEEQAFEHFLPAPIDDERACGRCYALDTCMLFRKTYPDHSSSSSSTNSGVQKKKKTKFDPPIPSFLKDVFELKTGHLTEKQTSFFRKWEGLLALEERDLVRFKRELWTIGSEERERRGRCWGGMALREEKLKSTQTVEEIVVTDSRIHRFTYVFSRSRNWVLPEALSQTHSQMSTPRGSQDQHSSGSLLNGHLNVGDPVTVSIEPNMLALARGYVLDLNPEEVVLGVDRKLDVEVLGERVGLVAGKEELIFRIDKDELFGGMARVRGNLAHMFYADGDSKRLSLVVDLRPPVFSDIHPPFNPNATHHKHLNPSQLSAMERMLAAEDYALILGMPGTGKTTVIAALILELVGRGKTVLLSSYTHSAVDTILRKLDGQRDGEGREFGILRLGNVDKVHPEVRKYTLGARRTARTVEQLELQIMGPPVVATTCLSTDHPLFFRRKFDYCIVDEASQITLPTCLGPLRFADTFVLVGDHFQLPPLVKNIEARQGGLDISLFRRLSEAHPQAVVDLRFQYRMNEDIMLLSNRLIYDDRLRCGNEEVAKSSLVLGDSGFLGKLHRVDDVVNRRGGECGERCWLERLADESCKAVFVDTDLLPAAESRVGDLVQNMVEAELVRQFTETLLHCGVEESQIGIITLYRQQVKLLHNLLRERKGVEILTADKSQGRDKDCIVISLVRSNNGGHIGELVKDWRRMNVSFTRARKKLVIFGSRKTLQREPLLANFFGLMQEKGWIMPLGPEAHLAHERVFDFCATPAKRERERATEDNLAGEIDGSGTPTKRSVGCKKVAALAKEKENVEVGGVLRPVKKLKVCGEGGKMGGVGVLKGRPILQDLVGNEL